MTPLVRGIVLAVLIAAVAVGVPFAVPDYQNADLAGALVFAMAILGLNILTGYSGQVSLGHGAFMAVGAFTAAIPIERMDLGFPGFLLTIPLAGLVCGLLGFIIGIPALRLEGIYLALATFALGVAAPTVLKQQADLTGGVKGIILPPLVSPVDWLTDNQFTYFLCLVVAVVLFVLAWNLLRGRTGRALRSIRDGELAARSFGVNLASYKTLAFAISAAFAGVAGSLYGLTTGFVSADSYQFTLSIYLLIGAIIGGVATMEGAVFGGLFVWYLPIAAQQWLPKGVANAAPSVTQGVLLLVVMFLARDGLAGLLRRGYRSLQGALERAPAEPPGSADGPPAEPATA